ncbi:MAG: gfo/Idh/MocA family oxidoreductase [Candidatus Aminicenantes bacterium]|nr:gfo/Idh/MocA family oxidoreductase [Candidatus Aminicenantes bacterium]
MIMDESIDRRKFIKKGIQAAAGALIVPRAVLGGPQHIPPSDRLTKAVIGVGGMGRAHLNYPGSRLLAVCDVDETHLQRTLELSGPEVRGYKDFREVLERGDIDIIHIATPPHWHGIISRAAAQAGKDIWCEKPMTRTIQEGKKVVQAVQRNGRIFRINTWFRFTDPFYGLGTTVAPVKKAVMNRLLGWPLKVTVSGVTGFDWKFYWKGKTDLTPQPVPEELDYDFWLGPAPFKPYHPHRVHTTFRGYWDYDGGGLGDMGMHYLDPVQYILEKDHTSPVQLEADCPQQHPDACQAWRRIEMKYADGCQVVLDGENQDREAPFIQGPEGKIFKGFKSDIMDFQKKLASLPEPEPQVTDFIKAVRERKKFALNEENGHRSCTLVNLGKIAVRLGRKLRFDPDQQCFISDPQANRLMAQPMRAPWHI